MTIPIPRADLDPAPLPVVAPTEAENRAADLEAEDAQRDDGGKPGDDENAPGFIKPQEK